MLPSTMSTPSPDTHEECPSDCSTDFTDDSVSCDESLSSSLQTTSQQEEDPPQGRKKSVRFSIVSIREFNVVEELAPPGDNDNEDVEPFIRRSLGWEYTDSVSDLETHLNESKQERKETYLMMIQDHIHRAEREKEEKEARELAKKLTKKKRGFKSKVLKPIWKGFIEAASRSTMAMPNPVIG